MEKIPAKKKEMQEVVSAWGFFGRAKVGKTSLGSSMLHRVRRSEEGCDV